MPLDDEYSFDMVNKERVCAVKNSANERLVENAKENVNEIRRKILAVIEKNLTVTLEELADSLDENQVKYGIT